MPLEGVTPAWERRHELGFWVALWWTWRDSVFRPVDFFRSLPAKGSQGAAILYYLLLSGLGLFFGLYWGTLETIVGGGLDSALAPGLGLDLSAGQKIALAIVGTAVSFVFMLLLYVALLFMTAAFVHVGFALVGAGRQGFQATLRALSYTAGPAAFLVFPFFGQLLSGVWLSILVFIGMREIQRTTNGRATLGFLLPAIALTLLFAVALLLLTLLVSWAEIAPPL